MGPAQKASHFKINIFVSPPVNHYCMSPPISQVKTPLGVLLLLMGLSSLAGGYYGMSEAAHLPVALLAGSPFHDYFIPSLFLFVVVGGVSLAACILVFTRHRFDRYASYIAGTLLLAWIAVQVGIIGYQSWMQPAVAITGVFIILLTGQLPRHES